MTSKQVNDLESLKQDMDGQGYCIVQDLIPAEQLAKLHHRIDSQSKAERNFGVANMDQVQSEGDKNQWVYMLINKGETFQQLFDQPMVHEIVNHVLGPNFLLSDFSATIAQPGNLQMGLHKDQWWLPEPRMPDQPHQRCGDMSRSGVVTGKPIESNSPINPPVVCNVLWMISDFTIDNGATRIVPGSHRSGVNPEPFGDYETVNATGSAGSAVIFEGRTWHAADFNTSDSPRYAITTYYGAPQFRQMLNFTYGMRDDVVSKLDKDARDLLGFKPWGGYGATGDQHAESITPAEQQVGMLGE
jgi:ectoine hydroxylase-related dioxygenase (phytanoyl-CoA dioxygenase family)